MFDRLDLLYGKEFCNEILRVCSSCFCASKETSYAEFGVGSKEI